jgi:hypothetical protein
VGLEVRSDSTFIKYPKGIMMHWWRLKIGLLKLLKSMDVTIRVFNSAVTKKARALLV